MLQHLSIEPESRARYGEWIRAAREEAGLTITETVRRVVARGGKLTVDGLSRIERNVNGPRMSTLEALAEVYGKEIGDLLPHTVATSQSRLTEPLLAALAGLDEEEIEVWIGQFAQTVTMQRSFIERRARRMANGAAPERVPSQPSNRTPDAGVHVGVNSTRVASSETPHALRPNNETVEPKKGRR